MTKSQQQVRHRRALAIGIGTSALIHGAVLALGTMTVPLPGDGESPVRAAAEPESDVRVVRLVEVSTSPAVQARTVAAPATASPSASTAAVAASPARRRAARTDAAPVAVEAADPLSDAPVPGLSPVPMPVTVVTTISAQTALVTEAEAAEEQPTGGSTINRGRWDGALSGTLGGNGGVHVRGGGHCPTGPTTTLPGGIRIRMPGGTSIGSRPGVNMGLPRPAGGR